VSVCLYSEFFLQVLTKTVNGGCFSCQVNRLIMHNFSYQECSKIISLYKNVIVTNSVQSEKDPMVTTCDLAVWCKHVVSW
jgi:hypothetical protein